MVSVAGEKFFLIRPEHDSRVRTVFEDYYDADLAIYPDSRISRYNAS